MKVTSTAPADELQIYCDILKKLIYQTRILAQDDSDFEQVLTMHYQHLEEMEGFINAKISKPSSILPN